MPRTVYHFEHWQNGQLLGIQQREAKSFAEAVVKLSELLKGVFKLAKKERQIWNGVEWQLMHYGSFLSEFPGGVDYVEKCDG